MAVVKAFKWMRFLSDADEIRKKKEKTKDLNNAEMQKYKDAVQLRNLAFVELLRAGIPFICIEDDDIVKISLDETSYDIDLVTLKAMMEEEEYNELINKTEFTETFTPEKEVTVDEQKNNELERLRKKIESYGNYDEESEKEREKKVRSGESTFLNESDILKELDESPIDKDIIDYRVDADGTARAINTKEIAVIGIEHGIGVTHTSILMAQTLAKHTSKKVALVEINGSNAMRNLGEWIIGREIETNNYPLGPVDVYFDVDYLTFSTMYKDDYDYIIVDFGCYSKKRETMREFIRIPNKYILASGIDWNLGQLEDFYEDFIIDKYHTAIYLIPYLDSESCKPAKKIVSPNKVFTIPFVVNPFTPNDSGVENIILNILNEKATEHIENDGNQALSNENPFSKLIGCIKGKLVKEHEPKEE